MRKRRLQQLEAQAQADAAKPDTLVVPHDPINEAVVIAAVVVSADARRRFLSLPSNLFLAPGHGELWSILQDIYGRGLHYDPATVRQLSGGRVNPDIIDGYIAARPELPPNLNHHVESLRWDSTRIVAAKGPVAEFLTAMRDPTANPDQVRSLARNVYSAFDGTGSGRYRRSSAAILEDAASSLTRRRQGQAHYSYGFPGLDLYGSSDFAPERDGKRRNLDGTPRLIPGAAPGMTTVVTGKTGCLAGDTLVSINRAGKGYSLRIADLVHMHQGGARGGKRFDPCIPTMVRAMLDDGTVGLVRLDDAYTSGTLQTFRLSLDDGKQIEATSDHRFWTTRGWLRLDQLRVGVDEVFVEESRRPIKRGRKQKPWYRLRVTKLHPHRGRRGIRVGQPTVPLHRLVVEASMNQIPLKEYLRRLNEGPIDGLVFLDPSLVVHHKDENPANNALSNLEVMTDLQHKQVHRDLALANIAVKVKPSLVTGLERLGEVPTYDLSMAGPHNFIANGMVVHNSGKTTSIAGMVLHWAQQKQRTLWGAWEVKDHMNLELLAVMSLGWSRSDVMTGQYTADEQAELLAEMERLAEHVSFLNLPFDRRAKERSSNDRNLDTLQQEISDVAPDHFIADLFMRCLTQTKIEDVERAVYRFQAMMQEEKCHGVLAHQLLLKGDDSVGADQRPTQASLKGASAVVDVADTLLAWYRPAFYKSIPDDVIECHILKQRYGAYPQCVELAWDAEFGLISGGKTIEVERPGEKSAVESFLGEAAKPDKGKRRRRL